MVRLDRRPRLRVVRHPERKLAVVGSAWDVEFEIPFAVADGLASHAGE